MYLCVRVMEYSSAAERRGWLARLMHSSISGSDGDDPFLESGKCKCFMVNTVSWLLLDHASYTAVKQLAALIPGSPGPEHCNMNFPHGYQVAMLLYRQQWYILMEGEK